MKELIGSAKIAGDAIETAKDRYDTNHITSAWFVLAYAALRILANIADQLDKFDDAIDHNSCCIVTRPMEY